MSEITTDTPTMRPTRSPSPQGMLFEVEPKWRDEWWGMPAFEMADARATCTIKMNFMTYTDFREFCDRLNVKPIQHGESAWYPTQDVEKPGDWVYEADGPAIHPKYPIYIPSLGRWDINCTAQRFVEMGVDFTLVAEPQEADKYQGRFGPDRVAVLPFSNLGQGSIPARNWIWEDAKRKGHKRHWLIDDNHRDFRRLHLNRRIPVTTPSLFRAAEVFVDRYDNIAFAGFNNIFGAKDTEPNLPPFIINTRIYSVTLINTDLPYRWRGRYNEDTDLCLRAMKDGWATVQFNAFLGNKAATTTSSGAGMKGGNTDNVYNTGDHRRAFAESLKAQHPDVVEVVWKFNRWHHQVDYSPFKNNPLKRKPDVTPIERDDEFGMRLVRVSASTETT